jgi:hypothetical protein
MIQLGELRDRWLGEASATNNRSLLRVWVAETERHTAFNPACSKA